VTALGILCKASADESVATSNSDPRSIPVRHRVAPVGPHHALRGPGHRSVVIARRLSMSEIRGVDGMSRPLEAKDLRGMAGTLSGSVLEAC
jgi:hypothetical protein